MLFCLLVPGVTLICSTIRMFPKRLFFIYRVFFAIVKSSLSPFETRTHDTTVHAGIVERLCKDERRKEEKTLSSIILSSNLLFSSSI